MKAKTMRRALLMSVISLMLCVSMLVGTTFAWFTDEVKSGNNVIAAGNLDVELYYQVEGQSDWTKVTENTNIFMKDALWEPGHTEVVKLKVVNEGTLALKYQLGVNVASEIGSVNVYGDEFKLSDHIKFGVVEGAQTYTREQAVAAVDANATALNVAYNAPTAKLLPKTDNATTANANEAVVTLVVYMPTSVDNVANHAKDAAAPTINLGINLFATQLENESDSFDNTYDEDAWHPDMTVYTVEELSNALASGGKIQVVGTLNAGATQDVPNWTNAPAEFIFDATTLDALAGGEYVLEQGSRYGVVALISAGESLALSDMNITANSQWPVYLSNYGGSLTIDKMNVTATQGAGIYPYGTNGTTIIKNATVNQKALSDEVAASTPWAGTAIAASNGHNLVIEDGTYYGSTYGVYIYNSGANVTINGGTFKAPQVLRADGVWSGSNKSVITVNGGSFDGQVFLDYGTNPPEIYINGGTFTNFSATVNAGSLVIKGGTFDADPSAYVAAGYKAVQNADGTFTVLKGVGVNDSDEMATAIVNGATDIVLTAGEYKMPSSGTTSTITITGTKSTVLDMTMGAYMENATVTIEGVTIKTSTGMVNGNGSDYAALYTPNVTYKNCTFVGPMRVGRDGAQFINCTFTALGNDYVWTYGNDVTFEDCTFNTDGKAILIYSDGGSEVSKVSVKNCVFNATAGAKAGAIANQNCAAIEIHNFGNGVNLTTSGNTFDSNFSGEWRIKTYETGKTQVIVNGTEYTTIAIDGKLMTIDASKNVTVQ